ncbi:MULTISPECIES: enoyl-CoA hydratase [Prescottella]|jgi:enoyl-CoA hydratase/carnithine racemase|uniref:Enoyl-CoA hydratase domain-containing protein 3, mitochondrial n=1 Tax=Rhodococcus hoagii TaxID=43767 RepID=A0AAE4ZED8_RHOHA|nr:enoyl-CoA hydratase [Prescottella equi]MBM4469072.1 enoyl-CoA hydratase [Prescottella equi]MBM4493538.1 enoyl-CoA hydratase [Prescottella equi]MBM4520048.1 enoyl-CoA hydratase [Prescottella equi]MBM4529361.1 enoyl-CoA hydratase [Prescottella equi]MBM4541527.1 enoyl-CoA hydratase [Prescottella equi]
MDDPIRTSFDGRTGVARLYLDRPGQRNPLSTSMMRAVTAALQGFGNDEAVRVVVLSAAGPVFSAGHDLSEMIGRTLEEEREIFEVCTEMMDTVQSIPQPVIAAVQGPAIAAGCQLAASCDLVVASSTAVFGTPGVRIGLFCSTPMVALSRAVGRKRAMQMLLTGETVDAATAADWGLVNIVVAPEQLDVRTDELAVRIAQSSPLTLAIGKQAFYRQIDLPQHEAYELMSRTMADNAVTCDAQEGMSAFLAKRKPEWTGK